MKKKKTVSTPRGPKPRNRRERGVKVRRVVEIKKPDGKTETVFLNDAEQRLLEVLKSPDVVKQTVADRAIAAQISRQAYYDIMRRPHFQQLVRETVSAILLSAVIPVAHKHAEKAVEWDDHHPAKMLYEATGILDKSAANVPHITLILGFTRPAPDPKDVTTVEVLNGSVEGAIQSPQCPSQTGKEEPLRLTVVSDTTEQIEASPAK
jgi:hypothetical protein